MSTMSYRPYKEKSLPELCIDSVNEIERSSSIPYRLKRFYEKVVLFSGAVFIGVATKAEEVNRVAEKGGKVSLTDSTLARYLSMIPEDFLPIAELFIKAIKAVQLVSVGLAIVLVLIEILKCMLDGNTKSVVNIITKYVISIGCVFLSVVVIVLVASAFL